MTTIQVEFGEGSLGFSLGSSAGIGVLVSGIKEDGYAESAGVLISDRVASLNGESIGLDDHWQEVVDKLKAFPRPVLIIFERMNSRAANVLNESRTNAVAKGRTEGLNSVEAAKAKSEALVKIVERAERIVMRSTELRAHLQTLVSNSSGSQKSVAEVLKEITETEVGYIENLCKLARFYILPIRNERVKTKCRAMDEASTICDHGLLRSACPRSAKQHQPMLRSKELTNLFLNIETILFINSELLRLLELQVVKSEDISKTLLGFTSAFSKVIVFFKSYSLFCHEYPHAVDKLIKLRQSHTLFSGLVDRLESEAVITRKSLTLSSLFIMPVQRICKYPLLFNELLKQVGKCNGIDSTCIRQLENTSQAVAAIADSVNQAVGETAQFEEFMNVYRDLGGEQQVPGLSTASRRYIRSFEVSSDGNQQVIFLFNDLIIVANRMTKSRLRPKSLIRSSVKRSSLKPSMERVDSVGGLTKVFSSMWSSFSGNDVQAPRKRNNYQVEYRWDIASVEINQLGENEIVFTAKERIDISGIKKTNVKKVKVAFAVQSNKLDFMDLFKRQHENLSVLKEGQKKGEDAYGSKASKRLWRQRTNKGLRSKLEKLHLNI